MAPLLAHEEAIVVQVVRVAARSRLDEHAGVLLLQQLVPAACEFDRRELAEVQLVVGQRVLEQAAESLVLPDPPESAGPRLRSCLHQ